jgi:hypothetical protein
LNYSHHVVFFPRDGSWNWGRRTHQITHKFWSKIWKIAGLKFLSSLLNYCLCTSFTTLFCKIDTLPYKLNGQILKKN